METTSQLIYYAGCDGLENVIENDKVVPLLFHNGGLLYMLNITYTKLFGEKE